MICRYTSIKQKYQEKQQKLNKNSQNDSQDGG
jgi:hypothetical protein